MGQVWSVMGNGVQGGHRGNRQTRLRLCVLPPQGIRGAIEVPRAQVATGSGSSGGHGGSV